jgi:serine/threonine-protein kinase
VTPDSWPKPGATFDGKFQIVRLLGEGGMGAVFRAKHLRLGELVALKVVRPELLGREDLRLRFLREARAAARLRTSHVARVLDVDVSDAGIPYLVLEHLEGTDLATAIAQKPLTPSLAARYALEACEALTEAHALGVVHRDIKPQNLFLARSADGTIEVKVLDFGLARHIDVSRITATNDTMGTPLYMPPEQVKGARDVDARGDVWSLGVTLFEAATGEAPFTATNHAALVYAIAHAPAPMPSAMRSGVPAELDEVVARCLEKEPEKRYDDTIELGAALAPLCGLDATETRNRLRRIAEEAQARARREQAPEAVIISPSLNDADTLQARSAPALSATLPAQRPKRKIGTVVAIALVGLLGMALLVGAVLHTRGASTPSASKPPNAPSSLAPSASIAPVASVAAVGAATAASSVAAAMSAPPAPAASASVAAAAGVSSQKNKGRGARGTAAPVQSAPTAPLPATPATPSSHVGAATMTGE